MICYRAYSAGAQCDLEIMLLGNHVQVNNEQRASANITEELVSHLKIISRPTFLQDWFYEGIPLKLLTRH